MSTNKGQNARALVEPIALDSRALGDNDLSALSLSHNSEQYTSNDFDAFANIQAELECMNADEVMTAADDRIIIERNVETETIVPDVEMTEISEQVQAEHVYKTANQSNQNVVFHTKPTLQRVPASAVQVKTLVIRYHRSVLLECDLHVAHVSLSPGKTECSSYAKSINYDSVTCEWTRY